MKYFFFLFIFFFPVAALCQSNSFSGKIIYEYQFFDPQSGADITGQMSTLLGKEQHYFILDDSYKAYDEDNNFEQLYTGSDNKYFFPNPTTNEIMVIDASFSMSEIISVTHKEETETILGKVCKQVVIKTTTDETVYFYSEDIAVDPSKFSEHALGQWNAFLKASNGSLPLKYVVKNEQYVWNSIAVSYEEIELSPEDFDPDVLFK